MRVLAIMAACAALTLGYPDNARSGGIRNPSMATVSFSAINAVAVVNLDGLPNAAQEQVYAASSQISDEQLRALRRSLGALPMASAALKEKGLNASNVLAAVIDGNGALLLITAEVI
jgi:hypothetical protein